VYGVDAQPGFMLKADLIMSLYGLDDTVFTSRNRTTAPHKAEHMLITCITKAWKEYDRNIAFQYIFKMNSSLTCRHVHR